MDQARLLGGIGSILMLLTLVPYVGLILGIVGFILVLIAIKYISDHTGNRSIFNNYLIAVILGIIAIIAGVTVSTITILGSIGLMMIEGPLASFIKMILSIIVVLIVIWVIMIVAAIFMRRSFNSIASTLNVKLFSTAALLYLIGAILLIVLGVGGIIILVAIILQIIAFFQIPVEKAPPPLQPPT